MLPEKLQQTYEAFFNAASENEVLDPKTTVLVQMAAAMAIGCYP